MDSSTSSIAASLDNQLPYAYDWPRDGSFINYALEEMGFMNEARAHALFYPKVVRSEFTLSGSYAQNFGGSGIVGGPVPLEIDEAGLAAWTMARLGTREGAGRDFVEGVCNAVMLSLDWFVRWRDPKTGLPLPANEDDEFAFTQGIQGSTAVLAGITQGIEFARTATKSLGGCFDPEKIPEYEKRRDELKTAILKNFYNPGCQCWGLNSTRPPSDSSQPVRGMAWFLWPAVLFPLDSPQALSQAEALWSSILPFVQGIPGVYSYIAETAFALTRVWNAHGRIHRDRLQNILEALTRVPIPGTLHMGETYNVTRTEVINLNDVPHVWEATLFYLFASEMGK
jgi:hypothetical protein